MRELGFCFKWCFLLFVLGITAGIAQTPEFSWVKVVDESEYGISAYQDIQTDTYGNIFLAGTYSGNVDLDPGENKQFVYMDTQDCFLQKLDANGNLIWFKVMGNSNLSNEITAITLDDQGNIYLTGTIYGEVDVDFGEDEYILGKSDCYNMFVEKLDRNGNFIWAKAIVADQSAGSGIGVDKDGFLYVSGSFRGKADFNPKGMPYVLHSELEDVRDVFVEKMTKGGELVWVKTIEQLDDTFSMHIDDSASVYITGQFYKTIDFDPGPEEFLLTANGDADAFVQKMDTDGNFLWASALGGIGWDLCADLKSDGKGNVYAVGYFFSELKAEPEFGIPELQAKGAWDIYVQKISANGELKWIKSMGGTSSDMAKELFVDRDGALYVTGFYHGTADLCPGTEIEEYEANGASDVFVEKMDAEGNLEWIKTIGGFGGDEGKNITVDITGNVYVTGKFLFDVVFDHENEGEELGTGVTDAAFVVKWSGGVSGISAIANSFPHPLSFYPNPVTDYFTVDLYKEYDELDAVITDVNGRLIDHFRVYDHHKIYRQFNEKAGVYFIKVRAGNKSARFKFVKK